MHYKRYLQSFEELRRTLGCTLLPGPRGRHSTGSTSRVHIRGIRHRQVTMIMVRCDQM